MDGPPKRKEATLQGRPETNENAATLSPRRRPVKSAVDSISEQDRKLLKRYQVTLLPVRQIHPSPENDEIYGAVTDDDPSMPLLKSSIERLGLEEPLIVTRDNYILSGHRRYHACLALGMQRIPVRFANVTRENETDFQRLLTQYNPQRVKSVASLLGERFLNDTPPEDWCSWVEFKARKKEIKCQTMEVPGVKNVPEIGPRRMEFLEAAINQIDAHKYFWPLTVRFIHYKLLNAPPLTQVTRDRNERWRYQNNQGCYAKLSDLLVAARYRGFVPWEAIEDSSRETKTYSGFDNVAQYLEQECETFLSGFHRNRLEGQPHYIHVVVEKNTVFNIVSDICDHFYVPVTSSRGYGGPSLWHRIWKDYQAHCDRSGDPDAKCVVILMSDHDPEGLGLADDCVASLRDRHDIPVEAVRPLVTMDQVRSLNLPANWAKETSKRFKGYVRKTGTRQCWECEALDAQVMRKCLEDSLMQFLDLDQLRAVQERQVTEQEQLKTIRQQLGPRIMEMLKEGQ